MTLHQGLASEQGDFNSMEWKVHLMGAVSWPREGVYSVAITHITLGHPWLSGLRPALYISGFFFFSFSKTRGRPRLEDEFSQEPGAAARILVFWSTQGWLAWCLQDESPLLKTGRVPYSLDVQFLLKTCTSVIQTLSPPAGSRPGSRGLSAVHPGPHQPWVPLTLSQRGSHLLPSQRGATSLW